MTITINEALKIGRLKEGEIIAGKEGLNRVISYVDVLEVPDIAPWLREKVLLLTTGYAIKDKPSMQINLIEELTIKGAAGLVIKEDRFLKTIPREMIYNANRLKLPIILIPGNIPYIEITHPLLNEILERQNEEYNIQEKFKELIKNSKKFPEEKIKNSARQIKNTFDAKPPYIVSLITFEKYSDFEKHVNLNNIKHSPKALASVIDGNFLFIYSIDSNSEIKIHKFLNKSFANESKLKCIISNKIYSLQQIYPTYDNIRKCLSIVSKIPWLKHNIIYYDQICHYILLDSLSKQVDSHKLVKDILGPLKDLKNDYKKTLIRTLYYYVKNNGNKTKAAKECYVHRNTFNYRINKLKKILNSSLDSSEELYKFRLALDLYLMIH